MSKSALLADLDAGAAVQAGDYPGLCRRAAAFIRDNRAESLLWSLVLVAESRGWAEVPPMTDAEFRRYAVGAARRLLAERDGQ